MKSNNWDHIENTEVHWANGQVFLFNNLTDAVFHVGWKHIQLAHYNFVRNHVYINNFEDYIENAAGDEFQIIDQHGNIIPLWKIREEADLRLIRYKIIKSNRHLRFSVRFEFRDGPVDGTGRRNYRSRSPMALFSQIRDNHFSDRYDEDTAYYKLHVRGKRLLQFPWNRYTISQRTWKKHRGYQWRE